MPISTKARKLAKLMWLVENKERMTLYMKQYYKNNREQIRAKRRETYLLKKQREQGKLNAAN